MSAQADVAQPAHLSEFPFRMAATPALSGFQVTLADLGYGEVTLNSPWENTQYALTLPDNWLVNSGSYLDLEFTYTFTELEGGGETGRSFFGELSVYVDKQLLQVYPLNEPSLERVHVQVDLPPEIFNERPGASHEVQVVLDAWFLCNTLHRAGLVIHPESTVFLDYTLLSPILDLANYPRPFYQRSFEPDRVRFVLPVQPSETDMRAAAAVAAGLGVLTRNSVVISATTDVDWLRMASSGRAGPEHLFVIGQPSRNQLITWLNDNTVLPIPMRRREMALSTEGPTFVMPGDVFSYTVVVTNTTPAQVTSLSLIDRKPRYTALVNCLPACTAANEGEVSWALASLSPGEAASFSLMLQSADAAQLPSQFSALENMAILANEAGTPLNASSLATAIGSAPAQESRMVSSGQDDYFFTWNGQPVPEGDGILQEILSPWNPQQVILVVTGVNEEAIRKAGQSLSSETYFPNMQGLAALVRKVRLSQPVTTTLATDLPLVDLGRMEQTVYGPYPPYRHDLVYSFYVPWGWHYTNEAYLHLFFSHSEVIDAQGSTLTVYLNNAPVATVALDQTNAVTGSLQVPLPNSSIQRGVRNRIVIQVAMQLPTAQCENIDFEQAWLGIARDSFLYLDQQVQEVTALDLDYFPFPFNAQPDLSDVLLAISPTPGPLEEEALLRLASALGGAASGSGVGLAVSMSEALDVELLNRYHIIAVGRPTTNALIQQVNSLLPQPFIPGTSEVEQQVGEVLLRTPPGIPLGYLQEIPSPWNERRALLIVTGTTDEAVTWATYALTRWSWRLTGNLALVREGEEEIDIQSIDTRSLTSSGLASAVATAAPVFSPAATVTSTSETGTGAVAQPTPLPGAAGGKHRLPIWVVLLAGTTLAVVLAVFGMAIWQFRQRRRS